MRCAFSISRDADITDQRDTLWSFHTGCRTDLVLVRNVLGRFAGAWFVRPRLEYRLLHDPTRGEFLVSAGATFTRAMRASATRDENPNLGLEVSAGVRYERRIRGGLLAYVGAELAVLFPFGGLAAGSERAMATRGLVGIAF